MIPVSKPFLPPKEEYDKLIKDVWDRVWLTNNGPLVNEFELKLKKFLKVPHILYVSNGTIALQIAIKSLDIKGEIITTPFSYVATTSSIVWEGCKPVFVDIDKETWNIDYTKIEEAITEKTEAILATHCFGNPCHVKQIQKIADKHNLKVIYDAAHCSGVRLNGKSVLSFGDISTLSFHATKLIHSIEGGAVVSNSPEQIKKMAYLRNFGHNGPYEFSGLGINGKNSEFHAAMGIVVLKYADSIIKERKELFEYYNHALRNLKVSRQKIVEGCDYNYSYYPVLFNSEEQAVKSMEALAVQNILCRRYFYPTLNSLDYIENKGSTPVAYDISKRILCLPLYPGLKKEEIDLISRKLLRLQNYG